MICTLPTVEQELEFVKGKLKQERKEHREAVIRLESDLEGKTKESTKIQVSNRQSCKRGMIKLSCKSPLHFLALLGEYD